MSEENGVGCIFHKKFVTRDIINIHENIDKSFNNAKSYYESVSDADKLLIKKYAQKNSCILQSAIFSNELEHLRFVHEVLEVDLTMEDNKAFVLAWEYMKLEVCEWIMQVVPNFRIKQTKVMECIQTSLLNGIIVMLEFAFNNFKIEFSTLLLNIRIDSDKFISSFLVNWITTKFPELKPKYNLTYRKICCGFSYNPQQRLYDEVKVTSCPVCIFEKEEYPEGKPGYILHLEHPICEECYNSMSDARLTSCPLCRQPNVIV